MQWDTSKEDRISFAVEMSELATLLEISSRPATLFQTASIQSKIKVVADSIDFSIKAPDFAVKM